MGKQITDLTQTNSFDVGDLLLTRKSAAGIDSKINQSDFIKSIGNTGVQGFKATSTTPNEIVLTPSNNVIIDQYYDKMVISFISPITSTGIVKVQIGSLAQVGLLQYDSTNTSILIADQFVSAIYDMANNVFYQTNIVTNEIYSNEYIATGVIAPDQLSTTLTLTSAIGVSKVAYYNGMSLLFTAPLTTKGAILINVDGLGLKNLTDPDNDLIPNNLGQYEAVIAIYDGTKFIKHMFSTIENEAPPIDPDNPIIPPENQELVTVGPGAIPTVSEAIAQLIENFGENGGNRRATIQLSPGYVIPEIVQINAITPWITIKSDVNGNTFTKYLQLISGTITLTGKFNANDTTFLFKSKGNGYALIKDAVINCTYVGSGVKYCITNEIDDGIDDSSPIVFENVNVNNFDVLVFALSNAKTSRASFKYTTGTVVSNNSTSVLVQMNGNITLKDINFGNVNRPGSAVMVLNKNFDFTNINVTTTTSNSIIRFFGDVGNFYGTLTNCTIKNTTTNSLYAVDTTGPMLIDGGDYRHPNSSVNPDILVNGFPAAIVTIRNNPLASYRVVSPGQTVPPQ